MKLIEWFKARRPCVISHRFYFCLALVIASLSVAGSCEVAQAGEGYGCGSYCDGHYGQGWTVSRTPLYSTIDGKKQQTGVIISIESGSGLSVTYNYQNTSTDCSAVVTLAFTRYGPPLYYSGLFTGICILSGPNGLVETIKPSTNQTLVPPTEFHSTNITTVETEIQALANNNDRTPPRSLVNAILALSDETSGCSVAQ